MQPRKRRGAYHVCRLVQLYGPHASIGTVVQALTQSCPHQHRPGERRGNHYTSPRCLARIEPSRSDPPPLSYDTALSTHDGVFFAVDEWFPNKIQIAQELAHVSRLVLAHEVYRAAVRLDPHAPITLGRGGHVIARSYKERMSDLHPGK